MTWGRGVTGARRGRIAQIGVRFPSPPLGFLATIVSRIAAEKPDFVLISGDCCMANGANPAPWDEIFTIIAPLYPKPNNMLYAIPGNHDMAICHRYKIRMYC